MAALLVGVALLAAGMRELWVWVTVVVAVLAAGLVLGEFTGPAEARRASSGESWPRALVGVTTGNRRRYGGYIVHFGVIIAAVGIAVASVYKHEAEWTLAKGGAVQSYGPYGLRLDSIWAVKEPNRDGVVAGVTAYKNGRVLARLKPRLNYYRMSNEPIATPSVYARPSEDLYLVLVAYEQDGTKATIKAIVSPLVGWIWIGGLVIGAGVVFALWPKRRRDPEGAADTTPRQRRPELVGSTDRGT